MKALKHTYIAKIPKRKKKTMRKKENKYFEKRDIRLSDTMSWLDLDGWPHSLTPTSYYIIYRQEEASVWQNDVNMSDIKSLPTTALMMEAEKIFETLVFSSTLRQLIAPENSRAFIRHKSFKSCMCNACFNVKNLWISEKTWIISLHSIKDKVI
jgi:hypothetical protein